MITNFVLCVDCLGGKTGGSSNILYVDGYLLNGSRLHILYGMLVFIMACVCVRK